MPSETLEEWTLVVKHLQSISSAPENERGDSVREGEGKGEWKGEGERKESSSGSSRESDVLVGGVEL